jgi:predicted GNAT family N-acyltransferase
MWTCRPIKSGEEFHVYDLILNVFHKSVAPTYSDEGIDTFTKMLTPSFLAEKSGGHFTFVTDIKNRIVGTMTVLKMNHIALLFVDSDFQGRGIGTELIKSGIDICLMEHPDLKSLTVSSSPNSKSFYNNAGFETTGDERDENGMRFTPMEKLIA